MWEILSNACLFVLAIIGMVQLIRLLALWFLHTPSAGILYMVVYMRGHQEEAELILRNAVERMKWETISERKKIICVDCGMDDETSRICRIFAQEHPIVELCTSAELPSVLEQ